MNLVTASQMRALDNQAIVNYGIPGIVLMENAGLGTVLAMNKQYGSCAGKFAIVFVGPGNNGGDGLVIARHLVQRKCTVHIFYLVDPETLKGDAAINYKIIKSYNLSSSIITSSDQLEKINEVYHKESFKHSCYAVVDSIFGTGLTRDVCGHFADIINIINNKDLFNDIPIIAVDISSGLNSDNGKTLGCSIKADLTTTYGCAKPGHFVQDGLIATGKLSLIDISIPDECIDNAKISTELINKKSVNNLYKKLNRSIDSHKGKNGHLLIIAGSIGKTGAAILSAKGASGCGCGLVSLCVPHKLNTQFESALIEQMTIPLPYSADFFNSLDIEFINNEIKTRKAVVLGPGMGTNNKSTQLVIDLFNNCDKPMIIDADALNILAANIDKIKTPASIRILTPHPGEMATLLKTSSSYIQQNRLESVEKCLELFHKKNIIVVLKGAGTIISDGDKIKINSSGNPGMATGGMGDVLTGVIGSLICQGFSPFDAAYFAVYLHGEAADRLLKKKGVGYTAIDVALSLINGNYSEALHL